VSSVIASKQIRGSRRVLEMHVKSLPNLMNPE